MNTTQIRLIKIFLILSFAIPTIAVGKTVGSYFTLEKIETIDRFIDHSMAEQRIPGVAIALIEDGKIVHSKGFGIANGEADPVTPETPFQLASITKSFTALLMTQLHQEQKLHIDDRVVDHIPWFETSVKAASDQITIRNLLMHRSGLSTLAGNWNQNSSYRGSDATELAVKHLRNSNLVSTPGIQYEYSNANYQIASHIIETIEGKPFEEVVSERVLLPLGMKNSFVQISDHSTATPATGFPQWFGFPIERPFTLGRMKVGDGGMVASANDLANYAIAVSQADSRILSKESQQLLFSLPGDHQAGYALGWEISKFKQTKIIEHSGMNGGFMTLVGFSDTKNGGPNIGFVVLSNFSSALNTLFPTQVKYTILGSSSIPQQSKLPVIAQLLGLCIGFLVLLYFIYRALKNREYKKPSLVSLIAPIILLGVWYANAYLIPSMNKITLFGIYPFFPDLAVGLIANAALALVLAAILLVRIARQIVAR